LDRERGYGDRPIHLDEQALQHLVDVANGDARALLNALELAVETTPPNRDGKICISLAVAEDSIQRRAVLYDKEGDAHFDVISAFIKSVRGSDPDAALYWLARMIYAGEDPRFILRRLIILAGEDVGLADPNAVVVVNACAQAFDRVGMPEGRYPLAQATLYLATAAKSNSTMGFFDALATVEREQSADVPPHLKDANRDKHGFGHGAGYRYPHAYRDHWVEQQYLPSSLQGQVFYQPSQQGYEGQIHTAVAQRRDAQLAAAIEGVGMALPEVLTFGAVDSAQERWLQRTLSQVGDRAGEIRDRIFELAAVQRHHVVLDLNAGSGLLTWEAVRQAPEGGVYAWVHSTTDATALAEQSRVLPELARPVLVQSPVERLSASLEARAKGVQFDCILGRNLFVYASDKAAIARQLATILHPSRPNVNPPRLVLAELVPCQTQRLYQLLTPEALGQSLYERVQQAEDAIYTPMHSHLWWDVPDLQTLFTLEGIAVQITLERSPLKLHLTPALLERWFAPAQAHPPSYGDYLRRHLNDREVQLIRDRFVQVLSHQTVDWQSATAFITRLHYE
jgi:putative ATPase